MMVADRRPRRYPPTIGKVHARKPWGHHEPHILTVKNKAREGVEENPVMVVECPNRKDPLFCVWKGVGILWWWLRYSHSLT